MIIPMCPICGHELYFAGYVNTRVESTLKLKRYMCVYCPHVEDIIDKENEEEFMS